MDGWICNIQKQNCFRGWGMEQLAVQIDCFTCHCSGCNCIRPIRSQDLRFFSDALASLALIIVTVSLTYRNWRLAISHVKQLCTICPDQTRVSDYKIYLFQIAKYVCLKLGNIFVSNWEMFLSQIATCICLKLHHVFVSNWKFLKMYLSQVLLFNTVSSILYILF